MAGRGTDILLGEGVQDIGGLHIIGTERHESRRIDNQLRGRAGRQGDPGSSQFYLSLEDELMRRFGGERMMGMMDKFGFDESTPIESSMVTKAIESAQKRVEANNFNTRKVVLSYDDVMNQQRKIMYEQRREVLFSENIKEIVLGMIRPVVENIVSLHTTEDIPEDWEYQEIIEYSNANFLPEGALTYDDLWGKERDEIIDYLYDRILEEYDRREEEITSERMREFEKVVVLRSVDRKWMDHIDAMDQLRQGIHLRGYGGTDPLREYEKEGFDMFEELVASINEEVTKYIMKAQVQSNLQREEVAKGQVATGGGENREAPKRPVVRRAIKVGRNDPCPCGSGKKYKNCHGAAAEGAAPSED
jgi:preprotein translocase subunit SecA